MILVLTTPTALVMFNFFMKALILNRRRKKNRNENIPEGNYCYITKLTF